MTSMREDYTQHTLIRLDFNSLRAAWLSVYCLGQYQRVIMYCMKPSLNKTALPCNNTSSSNVVYWVPDLRLSDTPGMLIDACSLIAFTMINTRLPSGL